MQASELSTVIMPRSFRLMLQSLVVLCCLVLVPGARAEAKLEAFPSGTPARGPISVVYAIYYANAPSSEPMAALKDALVREGGTIKLVKALSKTPAEPQVEATLDPASQNGYAPPDLQAIQYFGRGLSREQAEAVQLSRLALVLEFARPVDTTFASLRAADSLVLRVAEQTGGLLWDEETREIFTPDEWRKRRIDSWRGDIPDVVKHTVIHAYQGDKLVRAITLGMRKFGLPDVVINDFPWSENRQIGNLINLLSQTLAEGGAVGQGGAMDMDLKKIRHPAAARPDGITLLPNASGIARLSLYQGAREEGDPRNRLMEIDFNRYPGPDRYARQTAMLSSMFGAVDTVQMISHTDAILLASKAAKARLPALRRDFNAGLQPGEYIMVKAPFATPDGGREWMWVEVSSWGDRTIAGLLKNEPKNIPSLHAGQTVSVAAADVFDYIRTDAKGNDEGNETGKLMARQRGGK